MGPDRGFVIALQWGRTYQAYISKDIDSQPREFEEHRYFCSLGIAVPTERFQIVLTRHAREAESKLFFLMFNDTLRRVGDYCMVRHWIGGEGRSDGYQASKTRLVTGVGTEKALRKLQARKQIRRCK